MPPGKRRQSNAMLYTLITFIGLFIIATTVAVIYYVRAEELRTSAKELQDQMDDLATSEETRQLGNIVGPKVRGTSRLGTMTSYLDQMVRLVKGAPVPPGENAEVKVANTVKAVGSVLDKAQNYVTLPVADANAAAPGAVDPNQVALTVVIDDLLTKLQQAIELKDATQQQLDNLRNRFDDAIGTMQQTEQDLTAKVGQYHQEVLDMKTDYNDLRTLVEQNAKEHVQNYLAELNREIANSDELKDDLLKTRAELNVAQERLGDAMTKVGEIKPPPDEEVAALTSDGKVILVDEAAGVIHIDLGSEDRVYHGLTFSVCDKASGIPKNGIGKAEVEVFAVDKYVSFARILPPVDYEKARTRLYTVFTGAPVISRIMMALGTPPAQRAGEFEEIAKGEESQRKMTVLNNLARAYDQRKSKGPIVVNDVVANLIWDKNRSNQFVIAGEFDLNNDGTPEYDAIRKIAALIEKWGGVVSDEVSAETDFVILGAEPMVPSQPTLEQLAVDPTATEKHEAASQRRARYEQIQQRAQALWVPIFNYDRFLRLTGYASQIGKPGVF